MAAPAPLLKGFARTVATIKPDPKKRLTVADPDTRGLYVRVMPSGHKTFAIIARTPEKKQVWAVIGDCESHTLEAVREKAREGVKRIKQGLAPFPDAVAPVAVRTFGTILDDFLKRHVRKEGQKDATPLRSAHEIERIFAKYVTPKWKDRAFTSIRRVDVTELIDGVQDNSGSPQADAVLAQLSSLFGWYQSRADDYTSPIVRGMKRTKSRDRARERTLSDDEIRAVWKASGELGTFGIFVRVSLLTAQRRAKVAAMRWEDISEGVWIIPAEDREKGNARRLKLPAAALAIIEALPRIKSNPHVFAGRGAKAIAGFSKGKAALDDAAPMPAWVVHDLRRTAKTLMRRARVDRDISERVLGHVIPGVEGVYDRHEYVEEIGEALDKLAGLVALILDPPASNVVELRA
jgi:integrase